MSDAAADTTFVESDEAADITLGLPEPDAEMTLKGPVREEEHGSRKKTLAASIAASFDRIRSEFMSRHGEAEATTNTAAGEAESHADNSIERGVSWDPIWRQYQLATSVSVAALIVAAISAVALWPNGGAFEGAATEKGADAALMAPASKLAAAPLHERIEPLVVEIPAASPPQKIAEEVQSFWGPEGEKDRDRGRASPVQPVLGASAVVGEVGVTRAPAASPVTPRAPLTVAAKPAATPTAPSPVSVAAAVPVLPNEPAATSREEGGKRVASVASEAPTMADDKPLETETRLFGMITELSTLVRRMREEIVARQESDKRAARAIDAKLTDFERRLNLGEAQRALDAAKAASTTPKDPPPAAPSTGATKAVIASSPTQAEPASAGPGARYRVQAASPGLAMLSEIDRTGDDVAPLQVEVGAKIPGYGRVTKISQRGTEWVVQTEKGPIR
jgi:hypothetical protein